MAMISINVGGTKYQTTQATSNKSPVLEAMYRNFNTTQPICDADGKLFIDRNGLAFEPILEFLRTGQPVRPNPGISSATIQAEADYYLIEDFQFVATTKKIFHPSDKVQRERLHPLYSERVNHQTRWVFSYEDLPHALRNRTHVGKKGVRGCMHQDTLTDLHFTKVVKPLQGVGDEAEGTLEEEEIYFERSIRIAWVDLEEFDVELSMWSEVEIVVPGRLAKAVAYE